MNRSRKLTLAVIGVMTLALIGVGAFITLRIQQSQAPETSQASGFGATATRDLFQVVAAEFSKKDCDVFINTALLRANGVDKFMANSTSTLNEGDLNQDALSKQCVYSFQGATDNKYITLKVVPYNLDSPIAENQEALFDKWTSSQLTRAEDNGRDGQIPFFFGQDSTLDTDSDNTSCTDILFHDQNDFEVVLVTYHDFNPANGCADMIDLNRAISFNIAQQIQIVMDAANAVRALHAKQPVSSSI